MRVTVDLDSHGMLDLLKAYYNMRCITDDVEVFRTNRGYHVIGYGLDGTQQQAEDVRVLLGDDANRIRLDAMQIVKPKQILWTHKNMKASRTMIYIQ